MKPVDTDALFEKFMRNYMKENAGKFTEEEWEDKIPVLFEEFGKTPLQELGGESPSSYYGKMSGEELCALLERHIEEDVPVSDHLCNALVEGDTESGLIKFLDRGTDEELTSYAVNILRDKACFRALPIYLDYVVGVDTDENMRELMGEALIEKAADFKEELLVAAESAKAGGEYIAEALASLSKDDRIYAYLTSQFRSAGKNRISFYAHLLAKYGDERAVDIIKERIAEAGIKYSDYAELKYAIEALGGEYSDDRDFSSDASYRKIKNYKN